MHFDQTLIFLKESLDGCGIGDSKGGNWLVNALIFYFSYLIKNFWNDYIAKKNYPTSKIEGFGKFSPSTIDIEKDASNIHVLDL